MIGLIDQISFPSPPHLLDLAAPLTHLPVLLGGLPSQSYTAIMSLRGRTPRRSGQVGPLPSRTIREVSVVVCLLLCIPPAFLHRPSCSQARKARSNRRTRKGSTPSRQPTTINRVRHSAARSRHQLAPCLRNYKLRAVVGRLTLVPPTQCMFIYVQYVCMYVGTSIYFIYYLNIAKYA